MTTHEDRENILAGLRALQAYCLKLERESKHLQQASWKGKQITVTWGLAFDGELLTFEPWVQVFSGEIIFGLADEEATRIECERLELVGRLERKLIHLKEHEPWPPVLPDEWLRNDEP